MKKFLIIHLLVLLLSACGFHWQGEMQLAPRLHKLYLQTPDPYGHLARQLRQYLTMSHVELVADPHQANTILNILAIHSSQNLLGVSPTQQTRQFNLNVTVTFEITDGQGRVLVEPQSLSENRTITVQSNLVLGSSNEANLFFLQMQEALAYDMMNRIASREITSLIMAGNKTP